MNTITRSNLSPKILFSAPLVLLAVLVITYGDPRLTLIFVAGLLSLFFLLKKHIRLALWALFLRGSLDIFKDYEILPGLNIAAVMAVFLIMGLAIYLVASSDFSALRSTTVTIYLIFSAWGIISYLLHYNPQNLVDAFAEFLRLISCISIYLLVVTYSRNERDLFAVMKGMVYSSIIPLFIGFIGGVTGFRTSLVWGITGMHRLQSVFAHPNNYGHYLIVIALVTWSYLNLLKKTDLNIQRSFVKVLFFAICLSLILTFSRSAMTGALFAFFLVSINNYKKFFKIAFISLLVIMAILLIYPEFVQYTFRVTFVSENPRLSTLAGRIYIWQNAMYLLNDIGLFGFGLNSFYNLVGEVAHNDYLRIIVEYGIAGMCLFLLFSFFQIRDGLLLLKKIKVHPGIKKNNKTKFRYRNRFKNWFKAPRDSVPRAFMAIVITFLAIGPVVNVFNYPVIQWYIFGMWGVVVAQRNILDAQNRER